MSMSFFSLRANDPNLTNDGNFNKLAAYSFWTWKLCHFLTSFRVFHCTLGSPRSCFHITSFSKAWHIPPSPTITSPALSRSSIPCCNIVWILHFKTRKKLIMIMNWILFYLKRNFCSRPFFSCTTSVADPDLQIRGGWTSRPWDKGGGAVSKKTFFQPFGPHFSLKIRWGRGRAPRPIPRIRYCTYLSLKHP